ncbi:putative ribonuclease H-like domain-containing protein [Tanacetum coccineum]
MSSNSDDIQAAGSDTRPPMLDRTDYESWSQRIRLYCRGKENGLLILQSIDQGPFELRTTRNTLGTTPEGGVLLGPERPRTYEDLSDTEKKRYDADVRATNIVLQGLPKDIYKLINHNIEAKAIWTTSKCFLKVLSSPKKIENHSECSRATESEVFCSGKWCCRQWGAQNRAGNANAGQGKPAKCFNCNGIGHIAQNCTQPKRPHNFDYFKDKMLLMQAQENGAVLDEDELLFLADECDAFDSDVDDEPTAQSIFMANLSSAGSANPQVGPSNASILSEVHILENAIDYSVTNQDEHEIHNEVQQANVIVSTSVDMGNSNVIPYEQYLSVDSISVVPSCASSTLNDVCVSSINDAFVPHDPIATELKIYKEQVAIYEQRAKFELTEREQRMDDQMHMLIQNRTNKENLKKEHSILVIKQKESKFLTDFSNLKHLNDKLENKLHSQDQSIQTVHMMLNPTQVYDQKTKTALGAQNPFYLRQAKKAQPALYDGEELLKTHHVPVIVPSSEEDLELAETTRNKLHAKMNDSACVEKRVNITPPNYSKENFMATFTPQTQLTPEQNEIDLKSGEIERKNLLITNENLIAECLSKDVFYTATDSVLNVSRFFDMHDAFTIAQKRIVNLESENFNLRNKIQNDDHDSMIKHFSKLEVEHFNLQLKYQNLKERFRNKKPVTSSDAPSFDSLFVIGKLNEQIQSQGNTICELKEKISRLTKKNSDADPIFDFKALVSQNKYLTAKLNALHDLNERFRAENAKVNQHYKELYDSIKITRAKTTDQNNSLLYEIENLKAQLKDNSKCVTIPDSKPKVLAPGRYPIDVEPIPPRHKNNRGVHLRYIKHLKESVETLREIVEDAVSAVKGKRETAVKPSAGCNWRPKRHYWHKDYPQRALQNKGIVDSGCSRHMTGNKAYLAEYQDFNGGPVAFGGSKGYITGKGKIKTGKLDFEDVCFVKELQHFNLFSVSQMCDKKNKVLFTDSEYLVLSPEFKLPDENQVLLRIPRQNNMYSFNLENIVPSGGLACLIAKATIDESNKWHRRLGHVNFKNLNKLVKGNLVRGLPSKIFQNDHTCVACQKGKQHKASCKAKSVSSISQPLQLLHMDLFGPTSVRSLNHKTYCLVITDDFSRFSWVFFLRTKDETSGILKDFIRQIENQLNQKVKTIICDNGTEFKNKDFVELYSFLPNTFWAEAVSTTCYVLNRVLVTKPQNKTPYELITGKIPIISYIRPSGFHVTILNTIDHLGKFDGKYDEGFLVGYSLNSKAFRVYNLETKRVKENLHITFLENKPNVARKGPNWLFDLDYLTDSMNYHSVRSDNKANKHAGPKEANHSVGTHDKREAESAQDYFVLLIWSSYTSTVKRLEVKNESEKPTKNTDLKINEKPKFAQDTKDLLHQARAARASSTNIVNTASTPVSTTSPSGGLFYTDQDDSQIPALKDSYDNPNDGIFTNVSYDDEGAVADLTNLETRQEIHTGRWQAASCCGPSPTGFKINADMDAISRIQDFHLTKLESTICIVKNPVFHSKTKHIEIRHHFIKDSNEKKLIQMIKIYIDHNAADLLTKAFDVRRFQYLIANIGMLNP